MDPNDNRNSNDSPSNRSKKIKTEHNPESSRDEQSNSLVHPALQRVMQQDNSNHSITENGYAENHANFDDAMQQPTCSSNLVQYSPETVAKLRAFYDMQMQMASTSSHHLTFENMLNNVITTNQLMQNAYLANSMQLNSAQTEMNANLSTSPEAMGQLESTLNSPLENGPLSHLTNGTSGNCEEQYRQFHKGKKGGRTKDKDDKYWENITKLYERDDNPRRKPFLDDLFAFLKARGQTVNRLPVMAKDVLDLFELFNLVVQRGGLVEVIHKKLWQEIIKGLKLPPSITSAAFTLRSQYGKYLYEYETEKYHFSTEAELSVAVDGNKREGGKRSRTISQLEHAELKSLIESATHGRRQSINSINNNQPCGSSTITSRSVNLTAGGSHANSFPVNIPSTNQSSPIPAPLTEEELQAQAQAQVQAQTRAQLEFQMYLYQLQKGPWGRLLANGLIQPSNNVVPYHLTLGNIPDEQPSTPPVANEPQYEALNLSEANNDNNQSAEVLEPISNCTRDDTNNNEEKLSPPFGVKIEKTGPLEINVSVEVDGNKYEGSLLAKDNSPSKREC